VRRHDKYIVQEKKEVENRQGGDEAGKAGLQERLRGKGSLGLIELVHPSSEKGKPSERWGHKADGSR